MAFMIETAVEKDGAEIVAITANSGVFTSEEVECVAELWGEYLHMGAEISGYDFIVYRENDQVFGYACYGQRALTEGTYDLYWIATHPAARQKGVGRALLRQVEENIRQFGGRLIVVETSGLDNYVATRAFYQATGYLLEATLRDFYRDGDDLIIFTKHL
jgi:ribosomal protein S18 acetylase RimI-like enzyme